MGLICSNCGKKRIGGEQCCECKKPLGTEIVCIKLAAGSEHFCSKKCAVKRVAEARFISAEAVCGKCKYTWNLPKEAKFPVPCPKCEAPYIPIPPELM